MSADELERLLVVQEHDLALDRLRHRRESLPERAELEATDGATRVARRASSRELGAAARHACAPRRSASTTKRRRSARTSAEADQKLYSGTVTSPRELQAMQADVEMLKRHRTRSRRSRARGDGAAGGARRARSPSARGRARQLDADVGAARSRRIAARRGRDRRRSRAAKTRHAAELAARHRADRCSRDYERRRAQNRGAGAARLVGTTCQACHLTIPSTEAERIRRAGGRSRRVLRQLRRDPRAVTQLACRSSDAGATVSTRSSSIATAVRAAIPVRPRSARSCSTRRPIRRRGSRR